MTSPPRHQRLIDDVAGCIIAAFEDYNASFADISRRARRRFQRQDRRGMQQDVVKRYGLYDRSIADTIARLEGLMQERLFSKGLWRDIRQRVSERLVGELDAELYKTYFNTLSRRLFQTRGVNKQIEFVALDIEPTDRITHPVARHCYTVSGNASRCFRRILDDCAIDTDFADPVADSERLASALLKAVEQGGHEPLSAIELLETVFYRDGRAYLVGRAFAGSFCLPCVVVLQQTSEGVRAEALLTTRQQLSILFGFTYSYFLADLPTVGDTVVFLRTLLPDKPLDELYTVLGRAKQGKTERYRAFFRHLSASGDERLVAADGQRGLVMQVFTLPSWPLVFKLIRDRFAPSKAFGRSQVLARYRLVFRHDRVGRLIDAQEFRDLRFPLSRFSPDMLAELERDCAKSVERDGNSLVIRHCYVERRIRPLDLYLAEATPEQAERAVIDYGQSVRDLARSGIFPGDLLPKNFGVTRSGRVIFYDFDELRLMSDCRFRRLPPAHDDLLELSDETWFNVADGDVFPEQFPRFMGLSARHLAIFEAHHADLFDTSWWQDLQAQLAEHTVLDVPPFSHSARLERVKPVS